MANHKANVERILMRVPVTFKDRVLKIAHDAGMSATVYLETATVIQNAE